MPTLLHSTDLIYLLHIVIFIIVGLRIITQRPQTGVALAWLLIVGILPIIGTLLYVMIGERRITVSRSRKFLDMRKVRTGLWKRAVAQHAPDIIFPCQDAASRGLAILGANMAASGAISGNQHKLYDSFGTIVAQMQQDIATAQKTILMEFYIWQDTGGVEQIVEALKQAVARKVEVRLLVDAFGSMTWLKSSGPEAMRKAGIKVMVALPTGLLHSLVGRADLRLHRKVVVIDDRIAWTGSMNMVDPAFFKQSSGVGQWVDAMVRLEGRVIIPLAATVVSDWTQEDNGSVDDAVKVLDHLHPQPVGTTCIQVFPSGPGESGDGLQLMLQALISAAQNTLTLTTPYFVPDEVILKALRAAAGRGVKVSIIMPERVDSMMTRYASHSFYEDLYTAGIDIYLFKDGLLHTKSVTVDGKIAMFGSVNIDYRSLWLNYEIALFIYASDFTEQLTKLQQSYIARSDKVDPTQWEKRSCSSRLLEDTFRLLGPLL